MSMQNTGLHLLLTVILILGGVGKSRGQNQKNPDALFQRARTLAFESAERDSAKILCRQALEIAPNYHDVRIFLGRLYAWDNEFGKAEMALRYVLEQDPGSVDGRSALVDVYLWSGDYEQALRLANTGLKTTPTNTQFLMKKAKALQNLNRLDEALQALEQLLSVNPGHEQAQSLFARLQQAGKVNKLTLRYSYDRFDNTDEPWKFICTDQSREPWHYFSAEMVRRFGFGPILGRVNWANRFEKQDWQLEIDAYPQWGAGTYSYVNLGLSSGELFPDVRFGGEVFQSLPAAFEASLGFRYMLFGLREVMAFTGSAGKYLGNYWLNVRTFITPEEVSFSRTWTVLLRRYFGNTENYLTLSLGYGESPDATLGPQELDFRGSRRIGLSGQWQVDTLTGIQWEMELANEEWQPDVYQKDCTFSLGLSRRF